MIVNDVHVHGAGSNYNPEEPLNESTIKGYPGSTEQLKHKNIEINKALIFAQPRPYETLVKYSYPLPLVDFSVKNDELGSECLSNTLFYFASQVDPRDYRAAGEIERCVKLYNCKAIKIHLNVYNVDILTLDDNGLLKTAKDYSLPLIIHPNYQDDKLQKLVVKYDSVNFVIAHLGFLNEKYVNLVINKSNVFFDTSAFMHDVFKTSIVENYCYEKIFPGFGDFIIINPETRLSSIRKKNIDEISENCHLDYNEIITRLVKLTGSNKILFGSDEAWCSLEEQVSKLDNFQLSESEKEDIYKRNFDKMFTR